jgi:hypothetical protein
MPLRLLESRTGSRQLQLVELLPLTFVIDLNASWPAVSLRGFSFVEEKREISPSMRLDHLAIRQSDELNNVSFGERHGQAILWSQILRLSAKV